MTTKTISFVLALSAIAILTTQIGNVEAVSKCYKCSGTNCSTLIVDSCPNSQSYCQKIVTSTQGFNVYTKGCADACNNLLTQNYGVTTITYYCCNSGDFCNSASGISDSLIKTRVLLSLATVGVIYQAFG